MELRAALEGLAAIPGRRRVQVHSDSAYVVNCFRDRWYVRWEANGWRNAQKQPWPTAISGSAARRDRRHDVAWHKVAGHSGIPLNDRADRLAVASIPRSRPAG